MRPKGEERSDESTEAGLAGRQTYERSEYGPKGRAAERRVNPVRGLNDFAAFK
ncbi:MAG: hypothetical protein QNI99_03960 [Woeseiaceae bacterium]|nr:hypothetical protein [Woeseiaceae bacterium]